MKTDKVLERMELENKKSILLASKNKIKEGIEIKTIRGSFIITSKYAISECIRQIENGIDDIDIELEEITGLNQDKIEKYYKIAEE